MFCGPSSGRNNFDFGSLSIVTHARACNDINDTTDTWIPLNPFETSHLQSGCTTPDRQDDTTNPPVPATELSTSSAEANNTDCVNLSTLRFIPQE
ncbi:hypothetical protein IAQ61_005509 [Plenodomus lingam]|uniref:uncharacterized protein n=1 Tax=Leptosphaeria maculans TaxID=5022 RepID=UPI00332FD9EA|nr:hypothetical protein IAQ61_005509 [Plenodomus lingam]